MSNCSDFANWEKLASDTRLAALDKLINDKLSEDGYEGAKVMDGDLRELKAVGATSPGGREITIDYRHIDDDDLKDVIDTAYHEIEHAEQLQDGDDIGDLLNEIDAEDAGIVGEIMWEKECQPDPESSSDDYGGEEELPLEPLPPIEYD